MNKEKQPIIQMLAIIVNVWAVGLIIAESILTKLIILVFIVAYIVIFFFLIKQRW